MPTATKHLATGGGRKAEQLCQMLRQDIIGGRFEVGSTLPTQTELGKTYGVAATTAAIALSRLAHEGLVRRVPGRGTFVNNQPSEKQPRVIEFLRERSESQPDRDSTLRWIEEFTVISRSRGWTAHWHHMTLHEMADWSAMHERFGTSRALIAYGVLPIHLDRLATEGTPVVSVLREPNSEDRQPQCYPQITVDRVACARRAVEHLIRLGHRRIAYCGSMRDPLRLAGFLEAANANDLTWKPRWVTQLTANSDVSASQSDQVGHYVNQLMQADDRPQAFCFATYRQAMAAEHALLALGLRVPDDAALVSCTVDVGEQPAPVPITCFGASVSEICQKALAMIEAIPAGHRADPQRMIDPWLAVPISIVRDSCGARLAGLISQTTAEIR